MKRLLRPQFSSAMMRVWTLGVPLLFGQITHYLHQIADSAMLGHYGDESLELAAMGIAGLFTWILNTLLWPLSSGVQAITARRFGRQVHEDPQSVIRTGEALDNGILVSLYATAIALLVSFLARPILGLLIDNQQILELSLSYIRVMRIALLPSGLFFVIQGFAAAINRTSYVMYSGLLSNIINIGLNYLFIFGHLGMPRMGIRGAALGTVLSTVVSLLYLVGMLYYRGYAKRYGLFHFRTLIPGLQRDMVRIAVPPGIQNIAALAIFMIYQTMIENYSPVYLAATHAVFSYYRLNKTIIGGFARSAGILAGNALGRGDADDAQQVMSASGLVAVLVAVAVGLVSLSAPGLVSRIFTAHVETREALSQALVFFLPFFFVEALGYGFEMVFVSNGYGRYVLFSEFSTNLVFILGATILARHFFPENIEYAWFSFGLYQIFHAGFMIAGYLRRRWLTAVVERESLEGEPAAGK